MDDLEAKVLTLGIWLGALRQQYALTLSDLNMLRRDWAAQDPELPKADDARHGPKSDDENSAHPHMLPEALEVQERLASQRVLLRRAGPLAERDYESRLKQIIHDVDVAWEELQEATVLLARRHANQQRRRECRKVGQGGYDGQTKFGHARAVSSGENSWGG